MPALTGPALTAALLLAFAGAAKAVDPVMTVGALRALGLPSSRTWVRIGAAAELLVGLLAAAVGWAWVWWLVAASYLAFAAFVVAALRAGTMVGSCGCFGREDTPPHPIHVVVDVALAATAAAAAWGRARRSTPSPTPRARGRLLPGSACCRCSSSTSSSSTSRGRCARLDVPEAAFCVAPAGTMGDMSATHEVTNQPPPLEGYDVFGADAALVEAVEREGAGWAVDDLHALGRLAGSPEAIGWGFDANRHPPELRTHDRYGHRIDEVAYHPAYHELMQVAVSHGLHGAPWAVDQRGGPRGAGGRLRGVVPGRHRARLPDLDDLLDRARTADPARPGRRVGAPSGGPGLRPAQRGRPREARRSRRHGHDREAGRVRRPGQHHPSRAGRRGRRRRRRPWHVAAHRAQVVLLGADVGRVPDAGAGPGRADVLPRAPLAARRRAQRRGSGSCA